MENPNGVLILYDQIPSQTFVCPVPMLILCECIYIHHLTLLTFSFWPNFLSSLWVSQFVITICFNLIGPVPMTPFKSIPRH